MTVQPPQGASVELNVGTTQARTGLLGYARAVREIVPDSSWCTLAGLSMLVQGVGAQVINCSNATLIDCQDDLAICQSTNDGLMRDVRGRNVMIFGLLVWSAMAICCCSDRR